MRALHNRLWRFDKAATKWVGSIPERYRVVMQLATHIGEPWVVLVIAGLVSVLAYHDRNYHVVMAEIIGLGAFAVNTAIKFAVRRTRPDTLYAHNMRIKSYSFPSGHAFGAVFFYGLLACLAFTGLTAPWSWLALSGLSLLIVAIGTSRVYLGAHFPSDVLMGWAFGGFSLLLVGLFILR